MANVTVNGTDYTGVNEVRLPVTNGGGSEQSFVLPPSGTKDIITNENGIDVASYAAVNVNVPGGGGSDTIESKIFTPTSASTSVAITGLGGTPKWFTFMTVTSITGAANTRKVATHVYNGVSDCVINIYGSGSGYFVTYSIGIEPEAASHTYNNGTLTLDSGGANAGGSYQKVEYILIYGY